MNEVKTKAFKAGISSDQFSTLPEILPDDQRHPRRVSPPQGLHAFQGWLIESSTHRRFVQAFECNDDCQQRRTYATAE